MEYPSDSSSFLASLLGDIVLETELGDLSFRENEETTTSNEVVGCLVKSIAKRQKQTPKQRRDLLKTLRISKVDLPLDPPPLLRTDDSFLSSLPSLPSFADTNTESVI